MSYTREMERASPPQQTLRLGQLLRWAALWLVLVGAIGLLRFVDAYVGHQTEGTEGSPFLPLIQEMSGALAIGGLGFPVLLLSLRCPVTRRQMGRRLALYVVLFLPYSVLATSLLWGLRSLAYPLAGLGAYDPDPPGLRYLSELSIEALVYFATVSSVHLVKAYLDSRVQVFRATQLEGRLAQAELRNLRLRLQPHFLFNTLNTISSAMHRDVEVADEMLDQLASMLRLSLRTAQTDEIPLRDELEVLGHYFSLMSARFGDALELTIHVEEGLNSALVPSMFLQPLVENALRHGDAKQTGEASIEVRVTSHSGTLLVEVHDDGPGVASDRDPLSAGLGLSTAAERLELLYNDQQSFKAENDPAGGFVVRASFPLRRAE